MFLNIIIAIFSFLIGSFPTAYLLFKKSHNKDIRFEGSGNVGAMNAYEVSGKKWIGILTFVIDALKGAMAVFIAMKLTNNNFYSVSLAMIFALLGHNYNPFLGLKGGRGLATALGGLLLIHPLGAFLWLLIWVPSYFIFTKDIISANIAASFLSPIMLLQTPDLLLGKLDYNDFHQYFDLKKMFFMINFIILLKYRDNFSRFINSFKRKK